jgi:hypothetical protein
VNPPDSGDEIRARLIALMPILLLMLIVLGHLLFGVRLIVPEWKLHNDLSTQIAAGRESINQQLQDQQDMPLTLQRQVERLQNRFNESAGVFLTDVQANGILDQLYRYAEESQVKIISLESQPVPEGETTDLYSLRAFRVQTEGPIRQLMNFVARIRESSAPSVVITNLQIGHTTGVSSEETTSTQPARLVMDILLYVSPYASGAALTNLEQTSVPTSFSPSPTSTAPVTPTSMPEIMPTATLPITPTPDVPVVGLGTYDDDNPALRYVVGSYHYSADANAEMQFTFVGTDIAVQYVAFKNFGIFEVYVDGELLGEVDGYAPEGEFGKIVRVTSLTYNVHTLIVRNTGRHNPASEGTVLAIDAIHVLEPTPSTPVPVLPGG